MGIIRCWPGEQRTNQISCENMCMSKSTWWNYSKFMLSTDLNSAYAACEKLYCVLWSNGHLHRDPQTHAWNITPLRRHKLPRVYIALLSAHILPYNMCINAVYFLYTVWPVQCSKRHASMAPYESCQTTPNLYSATYACILLYNMCIFTVYIL